MVSSGISRFAAGSPSAVTLRYGAAVASVAVALGTALILRHYDLPHPFISFSFAAVAITSWCAGTGPGLVALLLSYLAMSHFFIPIRIGGFSSESYIIIYGIFGVSVSWFSASRHRAERLLTKARDTLELRVAKRTGELTLANRQLETTQAQLRSEKDRLKLLLQLTNDVVSNLEIREVLKGVMGNFRDVVRSEFAGVGLPDSDTGQLQIHALAFAGDGNFSERELVPARETLP